MRLRMSRKGLDVQAIEAEGFVVKEEGTDITIEVSSEDGERLEQLAMLLPEGRSVKDEAGTSYTARRLKSRQSLSRAA